MRLQRCSPCSGVGSTQTYLGPGRVSRPCTQLQSPHKRLHILVTPTHQSPASKVLPAASNSSLAASTSAALPDQRLGDAATKALTRAAKAALLYGWISFAVQLALAVVSSIILLFSVAFTPQNAMSASLYLTLVGILSGFFSCIWNFRYTRVAQRMERYLNLAITGGGARAAAIAVKKQDVIDFVVKGVMINLLGLGATLLAIVGLVWVLVVQTLRNATSNLAMDSVVDVYNPILTLDVFLVQAATNTLLGHFLSLVCSLWLLNILGEGRGLRFRRFIGISRLKRRVESNMVLSKGNALVFQIDSLPGAPRGALPTPSSSPRGAAARGAAGAASAARPAVGASTATAVVGFSAAAAQMQRESAARGGAAGPRPIVEALRGLRSGSAEAAAARPLILATQGSLQYLHGELPGDYGFDPLGFFDPATAPPGMLGSREWLRYTEVIHSRWAMVGVMSCLAADALSTSGMLPEEWAAALWFPAGLASPAPPPVNAGLALLVAVAEMRRLQDFLDPAGASRVSTAMRPVLEVEALLGVSSRATGDPAYPGGPVFNSLQLVRDSSPSLFGYKEVELVNGRLAMLALVGFASQGAVTGQGPYWNLKDHMGDPLYHNILFELGIIP